MLPANWREREQRELISIYMWWIQMAISFGDSSALRSATQDIWKSVEDNFLTNLQATTLNELVKRNAVE